jgi:dTDP-4-amino-4,6-dideoxygalactose transaminase
MKITVPYNYLPMQFPRRGLMEDNGATPLNITDHILDRIEDVAMRGDFTLGTEVGEFEAEWAKAVGTRHAIGMSNGTDAIAIALDAAGMVVGDEVITSPVSFPATTGAIIQAGGRPKFVDVAGMNRPNIRPQDVPDSVFANAQWFAPVLWAGSPYGVDEWNKVQGASVVLDSAQGVNALSQGRKLGELQNISAMAYSLHPLKNINVWGDGGMIATNHRTVDFNSRLLRNHGFADRDTWVRPGFNSRLSTVQAAVGLEVLPSLQFMNDQRQENAATLTEGINDIAGILPPHVEDGDTHGWHLYQIVTLDNDRDELVSYLNDHGVEAKVHYDTPLHLQEAMRPLGHVPGEFPNAEKFCASNITLPIHEYLGSREMEYTLGVLRAWAEAGS